MKNAGRAMRVVPREVVDAVRTGLAGQTNAVLMSRYGISYNTWRKVQDGDAVRRSVADRLERRMRGQGGDGGQHRPAVPCDPAP